MIKANELRIGNYVSDRHASESFFAKVKKLDATRCYYGGFHSSYSDLRPIPLTKEWLERFGFERNESKMYDGHLDVWYIYKYDGNIMFNTELVTDGEIIIQFRRFPIVVKYVHQLQNLYFALTGEELEFKE